MSQHLTPPTKRAAVPDSILFTFMIGAGLFLASVLLAIWPAAGEPDHQMRRVHVVTAP